MSSPDDAILEDSDRFADKINFKKIKESKNPKQQFLKEMEKRWDKKGGLYLWKYFVKKYKLINAVYKSKRVQKIVPKEFKGNLSRKEFVKYAERFAKKSYNYQKRIENVRERKRDEGIKISPHKYSSIQNKFLLSKSYKNVPLRYISADFNKAFRTKLSRNSIRDKKARLLGKK